MIDDLNGSKRTFRRTAAHADAAVTAAFRTSGNQISRGAVQHAVIIDLACDLVDVSAAADDGTFRKTFAGINAQRKRDG